MSTHIVIAYIVAQAVLGYESMYEKVCLMRVRMRGGAGCMDFGFRLVRLMNVPIDYVSYAIYTTSSFSA